MFISTESKVMQSILKRFGVVFAIATSLVLVSALVNPSLAQATGLTVTLQHDHLQPNERTLLYPGSVCPNAAAGEQNAFVFGTFTDANSQVYPNLFIGYSLPNGSWSSGSFAVPSTTALGVGSLSVYCSESASGGSPTQTFDPVSATIVSQTSGVTVDATNVWHNAQFTSVATCDPNVPVLIEVHDEGNSISSNDLGTTTYGLTLNGQVTANSLGHWVYPLNLIPSNGFSNPGYVYTFRATCKNTAGDYEYGSYNFALKADQYVALGDSYSAGVGSFNYDLNSGDCKRSTDSYPYYLVDNVPLDPPNFVACNGAVTDDLLNGFVPPFFDGTGQSGALTSDTRVVTLTIGGNDVGFKQVLEACSDYLGHTGFGCVNDSIMTSQVADRIGKLSGYGSATTPGGRTIHSYSDALTEITTKAHNAKVYISGYPRLFGENAAYWTSDNSAPGSFKCAVYAGTVTFVYVSYNDAMWMNDRVNDTNAAIENAVTNLNSPDVVYVPPSTFDGHGLCDSGVPYLNGVIRGGRYGEEAQPESFHPNVDGMSLGYGVAFTNKMN